MTDPPKCRRTQQGALLQYPELVGFMSHSGLDYNEKLINFIQMYRPYPKVDTVTKEQSRDIYQRWFQAENELNYCLLSFKRGRMNHADFHEFLCALLFHLDVLEKSKDKSPKKLKQAPMAASPKVLPGKGSQTVTTKKYSKGKTVPPNAKGLITFDGRPVRNLEDYESDSDNEIPG